MTVFFRNFQLAILTVWIFGCGLPFQKNERAERSATDNASFDLAFLEEDSHTNSEANALELTSTCTTCPPSGVRTQAGTVLYNGEPMFYASAGVTGVENPLTNLEFINLGSQTVGAGPNTGTLIRVRNDGTAPMSLGVPFLLGNNPKDFSVVLDSSSATLPLQASSTARIEKTSPLRLQTQISGPGLTFQIDATKLVEIAALKHLAMRDFYLPRLGAVTLELERKPLPFTYNAKVVVDGVEKPALSLVRDMQVWTGTIDGIPDSEVFVTISRKGAQGYVVLADGEERYLDINTDLRGNVHIISQKELKALGVKEPGEFCKGVRFAPGQSQADVTNLSRATAKATESSDQTESLLPSEFALANVTMALETDFQFFQRFGNSGALTNYVTSLVAAASHQYSVDVQTTLSIQYIGIHTTSNDGWDTQETGGDSGDLLTEFHTNWQNNRPLAAQGAHLAHFLSGATVGGGVAIWDTLCNESLAFAVSGNLDGAINWLNWTGASGHFTWDFTVFSHETGHNFGVLHTHDYCPPLDQCAPSQYWGSCQHASVCSRGTIMSYCHLGGCGGMANIDLHFHPVQANIMRQEVNAASCVAKATLPPGDYLQYRVQFNPISVTGPRRGTLEFSHDGTNAPIPFRVFLEGTAY